MMVSSRHRHLMCKLLHTPPPSPTICPCFSLSPQWWAIWFELFVLLAFVIQHARAQLAAVSPALLTFLAIVTSVLMSAASDVLLSLTDAASSIKSGLDAAAAGLVMLCVVNFLLIMLLGSKAGGSLLGMIDESGRGLSVAADSSQFQKFEMSSSTGNGLMVDTRHEVLMIHAQQPPVSNATGVPTSW